MTERVCDLVGTWVVCVCRVLCLLIGLKAGDNWCNWVVCCPFVCVGWMDGWSIGWLIDGLVG